MESSRVEEQEISGQEAGDGQSHQSPAPAPAPPHPRHLARPRVHVWRGHVGLRAQHRAQRLRRDGMGGGGAQVCSSCVPGALDAAAAVGAPPRPLPHTHLHQLAGQQLQLALAEGLGVHLQGQRGGRKGGVRVGALQGVAPPRRASRLPSSPAALHPQPSHRDAALGTAKGDAHHCRLPGHEGGQGAHVVQVNLRPQESSGGAVS